MKRIGFKLLNKPTGLISFRLLATFAFFLMLVILMPSVPGLADISATTTTLTPFFGSTLYGENITFTATVAEVPPDGVSPTGTVSFYDGTTLLDTVSLDQGIATYTTATLAPGAHNITATYNGDSNFASSTSEISWEGVNFTATNTALAATPVSANFGQTVNFTTTVTSNPPVALMPTGDVAINISGPTTATLNCTLNGSGIATAGADSLSPGTYSVTASYGGSAGFFGSVSPAVTITVIGSPGATVHGVGGEVVGVNKPGLLAPELTTVFVLILVVTIFLLIRLKGSKLR
jgi:hypothetical protein